MLIVLTHTVFIHTCIDVHCVCKCTLYVHVHVHVEKYCVHIQSLYVYMQFCLHKAQHRDNMYILYSCTSSIMHMHSVRICKCMVKLLMKQPCTQASFPACIIPLPCQERSIDECRITEYHVQETGQQKAKIKPCTCNHIVKRQAPCTFKVYA